MPDSLNDFTTQIVMSVFGGIVLVISEILPFVKSINSNGLLELLVNASKSFLKPKINNNSSILNHESEPLLNDIENSTDIHEFSLSSQLNSLNQNINNISYTLNNFIHEAQNSKQLKLQSIELYELNYIINYIKVNYPKKIFQIRFLSKANKQLLISQGYVVDYDSQNDSHTIKW